MLLCSTFAIASNVLFIVYAAGLNLAPILLLHALLLPINVWSLRTIIGGRAIGAQCIAGCIALGLTAPEPDHKVLLAYIGH
jgi:hypothetical protein